jgi:hypothetical protein
LDVRRKASIDALVENHPHDASEVIRAVGSSRKAHDLPCLTLICALQGPEQSALIKVLAARA